MPRRDGTGPMGQGAKTGRGFGACAVQAIPFVVGAVAGACMGLGRGRGRGAGMGRGFGWRNWQADQTTEKE